MISPSSEPRLADVASYVPSATLENPTLVERFGFDPAFLSEKIGIDRRGVATKEEAVSDMAVAAAEKLFAKTGIPRQSVCALVVCTQNPDYRLPATANLVQHRLDLPATTAAFDINQGCSGFVYGLAVMKSLMQANALERGLLITADAYSKVLDPQDRATVPIFGDGATASLVTTDAGARIGAFTFGSDGSGANDLIVPGGGSRNPGMPTTGKGALHMNGRAIFNFMMERIPDDVRACLVANGLRYDDVDLFLFHQASRYMVRSLAGAMDLPSEKVPCGLRNCGNTVSSTLPMLIDELGGVRAFAGKTVLLSGFGVGLSWASTVLRFP